MAYDHDTASNGSNKSAAGKTAAGQKLAPQAETHANSGADLLQLAQLVTPARPGATVTRMTPTDGAVRLPAGTSLDNVSAEGRDLVITLPNGNQIVVTDGAVVVPQLIVGDVTLPAQNL